MHENLVYFMRKYFIERHFTKHYTYKHSRYVFIIQLKQLWMNVTYSVFNVFNYGSLHFSR